MLSCPILAVLNDILKVCFHVLFWWFTFQNSPKICTKFCLQDLSKISCPVPIRGHLSRDFGPHLTLLIKYSDRVIPLQSIGNLAEYALYSGETSWYEASDDTRSKYNCVLSICHFWWRAWTKVFLLNNSHSQEFSLLCAVWPEWAIFWTLGHFLKPLAAINLPKALTFLGSFVKVSNS